MQVDFFIIKKSDGTIEICELVSGNIIYVKAGEIFKFGFETVIVGFIFEIKIENGMVKCFFVKKV